MTDIQPEDSRRMNIQSRPSLYEPTQEGLIFPEMPSFSSLDEERQYRKQHLVGACRMFAKQKFDYGFAGHLTVRDPEAYQPVLDQSHGGSVFRRAPVEPHSGGS